ncbi:MAG: class I SAM-dependent methyltransferase, partial [Pseudomonadota bacterium]
YQEIVGEIYYEILGMGSLFRAMSRRRLRKLETALVDPIGTAMTFRGFGLYRTIRPFQVLSEIKTLFEAVKEARPRIIGEVGSDMGGTLYLWSRILPPDGAFISIDLPRLYRKSLNRFFTSFFRPGQDAYFVREDSHAARCTARVEELLGNRKFDFLFIDGDHSYEGVKQDFQTFAPFVRQGGMIAFHDIAPDNKPEDVCGVDRFWSEIKDIYRHREIIGDRNQIGAGIGILVYEPSGSDEKR